MLARAKPQTTAKAVYTAKPTPMTKEERAEYRRQMAERYKGTLARLAR